MGGTVDGTRRALHGIARAPALAAPERRRMYPSVGPRGRLTHRSNPTSKARSIASWFRSTPFVPSLADVTISPMVLPSVMTATGPAVRDDSRTTPERGVPGARRRGPPADSSRHDGEAVDGPPPAEGRDAN